LKKYFRTINATICVLRVFKVEQLLKSFHIKFFTMKKLLLSFALLVSLSAISEKTFATCMADFTWTQTSANVISFTSTSTGTGIFTNYYWDFGNGNYDGNQNPIHTFAVPGTYSVCLTLGDSSCASTICKTITVTGTLICDVVAHAYSYQNANCGTCADGIAIASPSGGTAPYTYSWSTGETTSSVSGLTVGTYTVCINDFNGCSDCALVSINSSSCQALFEWWQSAANEISFSDSSQGTNGSSYFYWSFGDGSYDSNQNPVHTYSAPGTYNVCLYVASADTSCSSTYCETITVTGTVMCNLSVNGYQFQNASCSSCADGAAYAYATGGTQPYSYSWSNGATEATVTGLSAGTYTVCATDANGCTACTGVTVTDTTFISCSANFYLYADSTMLHNYYAVNLSYGSAPISYLWSWGDGTYDSTAYPMHDYTTAGYYEICLTISDGNGCSSTFCDSAYVLKHQPGKLSSRNGSENSNSIRRVNVINPSVVGIFSDAQFLKTISVFPNPVSFVLNISFEENKNLSASYKIFSLEGKEIMHGKLSAPENKLNVEKLSAGVYILQLSDSDGTKIFRKIIKQ
jgi:PKD repeat protein